MKREGAFLNVGTLVAFEFACFISVTSAHA